MDKTVQLVMVVVVIVLVASITAVIFIGNVQGEGDDTLQGFVSGLFGDAENTAPNREENCYLDADCGEGEVCNVETNSCEQKESSQDQN